MTGVFVVWESQFRRRKNSPGWIIGENGCHLWTGAKDSHGYGSIRVADAGGKKRQRHIHRVRYEREIGPVPEGMQLDHFICDNRGCCNPLHLRPVTSRENTLRGNGPTAQNAAKTHCKRGHLLAGENLVPLKGKRAGERECRACHNEHTRRWEREHQRPPRERSKP